MLCGAFFVVFVAAASITLVIFSYGDPTMEVACVAPRCLEVRSNLYGLVNASADPCVDFYDHVCAHWMNRESGGSFRSDNIKTLQAKLQEAITSGGHVKYKLEGATVLSQVYMACERYMATETTLANMMQAADTLLSLSTLRRARTNAEVARFLLRASIESGLYTVVAIMVIRDGSEEPLYIAPSISLTQRFLRSGDAKDASMSDNDSWRFILQVLEAFPDVRNTTMFAQLLYWLDAELTMALRIPRKPYTKPVPLDVAFKGLVDGVTVAQWMKAANTFLPAWRTLGRRATVLMQNPKMLKNVFAVLFSKGTKTAALYVSAYLASYVAIMERDKLRVRSGEITVPWSCLNRASECLTKTWPQLVGKLVNSQGSVQITENMFATIKEASAYPKVFTWLGERSRMLSNEEVASTPAVIQEPIDPKVNYSGLDLDGNGHVANSRSLVTRNDTREDYMFVRKYILARQHDQQVRGVSPPTLMELYSASHGYAGDVAYSQRVGVVVVPGLYQMEPYVYDSDVPAYFNYGTVGALLASQVRTNGSWWARDTHERYSHRLRCLVDLHYRLGFKSHVAGSLQEQQATMYMIVQGLRLAFDSMEAGLSRPRARLLRVHASERPNPLTPREMCLLPVHNMPEFAEAFGCSESARYVRGRCRM
ncbi:hypothetical protein MRX96_042740 [Rhipicephalus microplus]